MTDRYTNNDIKLTLGDLRSKIRNGQITVFFRDNGPTQLRVVVAAAFGIDKDAFNSENFNPQTMKRFAKLFDVPRTPITATTSGAAWLYPSQDDVATALQNFLNRRADPWSHWVVENSVTATSADPIASLVQENG